MKKRVVHSYTAFFSIVHALFLRSLHARFGSQKLGYVWAVLDAMIPIMIFSLVHSALSGTREAPYDHAVFVALGFVAYNFFRNIVKNSMDVFDSNRQLYAYRQVRPIHTFVALYLTEFLIMFVTVCFLLALGFVLDRELQVENFTMVVASVLWLSFFGIGLAILFSVLGVFFAGVKKVVNLAFLPLMLLSGLFYTVDSLPHLLREYILWNPLVHYMEMLHGNYFTALDTRYVSYPYMFFWTVVPLSCGLFLYRRLEKKIIQL